MTDRALARQDDLTRQIEVMPFRDGPGPVGMDVTFLLSGPMGATQFKAWATPRGIMPVDLGFHAVEPRSYQRAEDRQECHALPQGYCYYDGSGLNARPVWEAFAKDGPEAVWAALEDYYRRTFEATDKE